MKSDVVKEPSRDEKIESIMAIKDDSKRLKAISENISLFHERDAEIRERNEAEKLRRLGGK